MKTCPTLIFWGELVSAVLITMWKCRTINSLCFTSILMPFRLNQQSPHFWGPGIGFMEDKFSTGWVGRGHGFGMILLRSAQPACLACSVHCWVHAPMRI